MVGADHDDDFGEDDGHDHMMISGRMLKIETKMTTCDDDDDGDQGGDDDQNGDGGYL